MEEDLLELLKGDTAAEDSTAADSGDLLASFAPQLGNTDSLCVPRVNDLIWDKMKPPTRSQDAGLQAVQQTLVKGATVVIRVADSLLSKQPALATELSTLLDAVFLLGSTVSKLNQKRGDLVRPDLNDRYRFIRSASVPVTSQLFGEELAKQMRDISEANKMGSQLRDPQGAGWQPARGR